ncbi:MAG: hypothetical protein ACOC1F_00035 [Myxococcota bacterium]
MVSGGAPDGGSAGDASAPDASASPCEGVTCNTPPSNTCANENQLRVYSRNGTCDAGTCSYTSQLVDCPSGCENDACMGDPCVGVTCNTPPANECADATHLAVYDVPGTCNEGTCSYDTHNQYCAHGCENGSCNGDPCAGVSCNSPPANYCASADQLAVYETPGTCDEGTCSYDSHQEYCEFGCVSGACEGDPCVGVTCISPPADYCIAADSLREYEPSGQCADGSCVYDYEDVPCEHGCTQGGCRECTLDTDCGSGLWCNNGTCKPCDENAHCGPECANCSASGDVCNASSTACVDCNGDGDCASTGEWCDNNTCAACDTNDHCGSDCVACDAAHPCDGSACRCTPTSCGAYNRCVNGACAFCDSSAACGASCGACTGATPHCLVAGTTSSCVECLDDGDCGSGYVCDVSNSCVYDPCKPPAVACTTGSENRDGWNHARTIGRVQASSSGGYQISDTTCSADDDFDESSGCWDANADHAYRIYLREGEQIEMHLVSQSACDGSSAWRLTLSVYGTEGECLSTTKDSRLFCVDREYEHSETYTAPHDGWFYVIVDGSHASGDEGDYDFQLLLTCSAAGCGCD